MMTTATLALFICTMLALTHSSTRGMAIIGAALCVIAAPITTIAIALILGIAYFVYHHYLKGN